MEMPKPTEEDKAQFRALIPVDPAITVKPMFGNLAAFVHGNMFAGLFGSSLGVKLLERASLEKLRAVPGSGPYGPPERPMGSFVALPASWHSETELATAWLETALTQVSTMPPKAPKPRGANPRAAKKAER